MISLFINDGGVNATDFLADHAEQITVLADAGFLSRLHYAERSDPQGRFGEIDIRQMTVTVFRNMARWNEEGPSDHLYLVADEKGEGARLAALRADYPNLTFRGLAEHLFPALVARNPKAVFAPVPQDLMCKELTLIFATPRSGSSYLADVVGDCGLGDAREHLRNSVIDALTADYRFNRALALRNFLNLISKDGRAATKIIGHFFSRYLTTVAQDLELLRRLCDGMTTRVIILDRDDKVGQAVSAFLASRRGIWHVRSEADAAKLDQANTPDYAFNRLLARYTSFREQSAILGLARDFFPQAIELEYDRDIADATPGALANRLQEAFGLSGTLSGQRAADRQKLANAENAEICAQFRADYRVIFGIDP